MATSFPADRELVLERLIQAPPDKVFRCWTDPALIPRWFCPPPWSAPFADLDVRPGGASLILMRGPNGEQIENRGVYLEVVPNARLVFTDAYVRAWEPSNQPFLTAVLTFEAEGNATRYTARARHWSAADRQKHEAMGFHAGWGITTDQLEALARSI